MRIDILTVVPQLLESPLNYSIIKRAREKGVVEIFIHDIRKYGKGNYRQVDDYNYGGDAREFDTFIGIKKLQQIDRVSEETLFFVKYYFYICGI